jgi:hypothetical protein
MRHAVSAQRLSRQQIHALKRLRLPVLDPAAVIDHLLAGRHDATDGPVVGVPSGDDLRALRLDGALEQMGLGVEPGLERLPALGRDLKHIEAAVAVGLAGQSLYSGAAEVRTPPEIGVPVGLVHRQLPHITAALRGDRA